MMKPKGTDGSLLYYPPVACIIKSAVHACSFHHLVAKLKGFIFTDFSPDGCPVRRVTMKPKHNQDDHARHGQCVFWSIIGN